MLKYFKYFFCVKDLSIGWAPPCLVAWLPFGAYLPICNPYFTYQMVLAFCSSLIKNKRIMFNNGRGPWHEYFISNICLKYQVWWFLCLIASISCNCFHLPRWLIGIKSRESDEWSHAIFWINQSYWIKKHIIFKGFPGYISFWPFFNHPCHVTHRIFKTIFCH